MIPHRIEPLPGQESVWDYPRPPAVESCSAAIKVLLNNYIIAESTRAKRVLETSHPPVYYIPPDDVRMDLLELNERQSWCEWKGQARYFDVILGEHRIPDAAWAYPTPIQAFDSIRDYLAFYPHLMDECFVDEELVQAQSGGFYGGWITSNIVGPFKGEAGTWGW